MYHDGYWPETREASIALKVGRDRDSEAQNVAGIKLFAPFLTPHKDGKIRFNIFTTEETHAHLQSLPDLSVIEVVRGTHHVDQTFTTPEAAVAYVRKHFWYET